MVGKAKDKKFVDFRRDGDVLHVKVSDCAHQVYYKNQASFRNERQIKQILEDLKKFGVDLELIGRSVKLPRDFDFW